LVIETCIATGARISEVLGLKWKHINLEAATIQIEQRVWHQDVGRPKSEDSRRVLGIGDLVQRFREKATNDGAKPEAWVFCQKHARPKPLWDSGVRDALHQAAEAEGCNFLGLGPHSFRRANITWRQQIAGHCDLEMTGEYTFVTPERQNELTRRLQQKLVDASRREKAAALQSRGPDVSPGLADAKTATLVVQ
jgi:integrase